MRDHPATVDVARRLVSALKQTLNSSFVSVVSLSAAAKFAQFSVQCLQAICSSYRHQSSVAVVLPIQRLTLQSPPATVRVVYEVGAMTSSASMNAMKVRKPEPAEIEYKNMKFLITYRPTDATMDRFIEELKRHNVKDVVRVCEPSYSTDRLGHEGIKVVDLPFDDGTPPPDNVVFDWFEVLRSRFTADPRSCVAVHCIAGLGRAPVLVALALIELGMKYEDAVELIREKRRGAINAKQLAYLERYHPKSRLKSRSKNGHNSCRMM